MELLIAILIALGSLVNPYKGGAFTVEEQTEIGQAQNIIDSNQYHFDECGGVVIDDEVSTHQ